MITRLGHANYYYDHGMPSRCSRDPGVYAIYHPDHGVNVIYHPNHGVNVIYHPDHGVDVIYHPDHGVNVIYHPDHGMPSNFSIVLFLGNIPAHIVPIFMKSYLKGLSSEICLAESCII